MRKPTILLLSSEVTPFAKTGGLADVAGSLPIALSSLGYDIRVMMPYFAEVRKNGFKIKLVDKEVEAESGGTIFKFALYHCKRDGVDFYFIENDDYFDRDFLYGTSSGDYPDNAVRFAFFANAALSSTAAVNFIPDIIHCNDWQTALVPFYLKYKPVNAKLFQNTKTIFTIHNLAYQGLFSKDFMPKVGVGYEFFTPDTLEFWGDFSFIKSGILYSDVISTVSKGYAREILTKEYGCGLEGLLALRKDDIYGILNGVDYTDWSPQNDKYIKLKYDEDSLEKKVECKKDLLLEMKFDAQLDAPLLGVVTRLAHQKGIDVIADSMEGIVKLGCNIVILGTGEEKYHKLLTDLSKKHPRNFSVKIDFDNGLAHKIEAGSDMFLMPSRYEPCGLNQMYSLKYGTIPIVRATGGLDDTIVDYSDNAKEGNGFRFKDPTPQSFLGALKRAVAVYKNKDEWRKLMKNGMGLDFSWAHTAKEYAKFYTDLKNKN